MGKTIEVDLVNIVQQGVIAAVYPRAGGVES